MISCSDLTPAALRKLPFAPAETIRIAAYIAVEINVSNLDVRIPSGSNRQRQ
jgi:hypothetical protein